MESVAFSMCWTSTPNLDLRRVLGFSFYNKNARQAPNTIADVRKGHTSSLRLGALVGSACRAHCWLSKEGERENAMQRHSSDRRTGMLEKKDIEYASYHLSHAWPKCGGLKYASLLLGSFLFCAGLGFRLNSPAFASVKFQTTQQATVQDTPTRVPEPVKETQKDLRDEFWEGIEAPKGSLAYILKCYLEKYPNNIKALKALVYTQLEKQNIATALKILETLLVLDPTELEWKLMKAQAHDYLGNLDMARKGYEDILAVRPLSAKALEGLAMIMYQNGEAGAALEMIEAALRRAIEEEKITDARNLRMLIGQFCTLKEEFDKALEQYAIMVNEDPNDFRPYLCQGIVYSILGNSKEAEKQFKEYQKRCPKDYPKRSYLDELLLKAKMKGRKSHDSQHVASRPFSPGGKDAKPMKQPSVAVEEFNQPKAVDTSLGSK